MAKVLVVEDEESMREALKYNLVRSGYEVITAAEGLEAVERARAGQPDLVLLDLMLPGIDGYEVCRRIRRESSVPILILTARDEEFDKVLGLELGADDYVTKPFSVRELLARVKAMLRRTEMQRETPATTSPAEVLSASGLELDLGQRTARLDDHDVSLTAKEFDLLAYLMQNRGRVLSRQQILDRVWGYDYVGDPRTVDVHIRWLREKIETDPARPRRLQTVRGVGYRLAP